MAPMPPKMNKPAVLLPKGGSAFSDVKIEIIKI
jgi:hypothetical protein